METSQQPQMMLYLWQNCLGTPLSRLVGRKRYENNDDIRACGISASLFPTAMDMVVPDLNHENVYHDIKLVADKSSQRPCPWNPKLSIVFLNQQWIDGTPYDLCSRTLLQKASARLRKEHGLEMRAGIELEFILVRKVVGADGTPDYVPIDSSAYACAKPLATWEDDLLAIEEQLASIGIEVEQIHHEASQGQFEFAIKYTEVVRTIENYLIARMVIQKQFEKKGIIVSFVPKMSSEAVGNGAHVHLSLWKIDGVETLYNIVGDKSTEYLISEQFQSFMAGIKHHLPALAQFMAPTPNSIKRICESGHWAGNYIVWGYDNKEAVLRIQSPASKEVGCTNLELKTFDHTSNIFLGLANVIVCGLDGMKKNMKLPPPVASDPGEMTSMEREAQGIQMMPMNIKERKDILLGDGDVGQPIREFMGIKALEIHKNESRMPNQQDMTHYKSNFLKQFIVIAKEQNIFQTRKICNLQTSQNIFTYLKFF